MESSSSFGADHFTELRGPEGSEAYPEGVAAGLGEAELREAPPVSFGFSDLVKLLRIPHRICPLLGGNRSFLLFSIGPETIAVEILKNRSPRR
ncbi:hypothetical protein L484_011190 [Morus notabilis]|uniref:Uncharacterized protein n=1 Tax=Morus notabilis TaxID=981085 RepID=W9SYR0_9ROSA|nr:hypothetical protein L484_011190 [Morus notabilis]